MSCIFRAKLEELKKDIFQNNIFGHVIVRVYVIEFQKRGLPHAHILIILRPEDKFQTPDDYDSIVRVEIPNPDTEPRLHRTVIKHMMHGPCGPFNPSVPCMQDGKCKKGYPRD